MKTKRPSEQYKPQRPCQTASERLTYYDISGQHSAEQGIPAGTSFG